MSQEELRKKFEFKEKPTKQKRYTSKTAFLKRAREAYRVLESEGRYDERAVGFSGK